MMNCIQVNHQWLHKIWSIAWVKKFVKTIWMFKLCSKCLQRIYKLSQSLVAVWQYRLHSTIHTQNFTKYFEWEYEMTHLRCRLSTDHLHWFHYLRNLPLMIKQLITPQWAGWLLCFGYKKDCRTLWQTFEYK